MPVLAIYSTSNLQRSIAKAYLQRGPIGAMPCPLTHISDWQKGPEGSQIPPSMLFDEPSLPLYP